MIPKFKIGDRVKSKFFDEEFVIHRISISALGIEYCDYNGVPFTEEVLSICIEPKPKVKKYLYAYKDSQLGETISRAFYKDDEEFNVSNSVFWFQRLDWSMIEVSE